MNKSVLLLALSLFFVSCSGTPQSVSNEAPDGKGPNEMTLLTQVDPNGARAYQLTTYDQSDTVSLNNLNDIRAEVTIQEDGSTDYVLYFNDERVGELSWPGESALSVVHTGWFQEEGYSYSQPYVYLHLSPSGLGGYINYPVHGSYFRINTQTKVLEPLPAAIDDFFAGALSDGSSIFKGVSVESNAENSFTVTVTNLNDLSTETFTYTDAEFFQGGNPYFSSPEGDKVVFSISKGDADNEMSALILLDLSTGEFEEIERKEGLYDLNEVTI